MIMAYTGPNGSGKTLHAVKEVLNRLFVGKRIIANFEMTPPKKYLKNGRAPLYWSNKEMTVKNLLEYASETHSPEKLSQTMVVIDECQLFFSSLYMNKDQFKGWMDFFAHLHRKRGFDFLLITQDFRSLERPLRGLIATETYHLAFDQFPSTNMSYYIMWLLTKLFRIQLFIGITELGRLRGKAFRGRHFFTFSKKVRKVYDTFKEYDNPSGTSDKVTDSGKEPNAADGDMGPHPPKWATSNEAFDSAARRAAELDAIMKDISFYVT